MDKGHEVAEQSRGKADRPDHEAEVGPVGPQGLHDVVGGGRGVELLRGSEGEAAEDSEA